jgi:hypothetical protein
MRNAVCSAAMIHANVAVQVALVNGFVSILP